jgi:hypothetical protein
LVRKPKEINPLAQQFLTDWLPDSSSIRNQELFFPLLKGKNPNSWQFKTLQDPSSFKPTAFKRPEQT